MAERKTIAIDFDGCIHSYTSGWQGPTEIPDPPVPGAFEFIEAVLEHFDVVIFTTRIQNEDTTEYLENEIAILEWFVKHGMPDSVRTQLRLTAIKPKALVYIDDRGFRFEGAWPTVDELKAMKPWNKK